MFGSGLKTIDSSAFSDCTGLTEVTIPDGVTELGWWAFDGCTSLQSVVIGDGVELIDHYAFRDCTSLTDVTFGERVREIGGNAFSGCTGFKTLEVNVETIGMSAFQDCTGLVELILGEGVKSIEAFAFENCTALQDVYCYATTKPSLSLGINPFEDLPDDATLHVPCASLDSYEYWGSFDYVVGIMPVLTVKANDPSMGEVTIEQEADCDLPAIIKATAYEGYTFVKWDDGNTANPRTVDVTEDITLTAEFAKGQTVQTYIFEVDGIVYHITNAEALTVEVTKKGEEEPGAVGYTGEITIPATVTHENKEYKVTRIGDYAFVDNSGYDINTPTSITIPEGVTTIGKWAFYQYQELTTVSLPAGIDSIGSEAFYDCRAMTAVHYGGTIGQWCNIEFTNANSNPVTWGHNLYVGKDLLTKLVVPAEITGLKPSTFRNCTSLTSAVLHDGMTSVGQAAFYGCSNLASVTFGEGLESIGMDAFHDCSSLTEVTIPDGVTTPDWNAFDGCTGLTELRLGKGLTGIGWHAFTGCTALTDVYCYAPAAPAFDLGNPFEDLPDDATLHVPCALLDSYLSWGTFGNVVGIVPVLKVEANDPSIGEVIIEQEADCDQPAIIRAMANEGYTFVQWNDGNTDNPRTVEVTEDMTLTAEFAPKGTGINSAEQQLVVTSGQGCIRVQGASGMVVSVYNTQGLRLYQGVTEEVTTITVPSAGLYVVAVGEDLVKVIVK